MLSRNVITCAVVVASIASVFAGCSDKTKWSLLAPEEMDSGVFSTKSTAANPPAGTVDVNVDGETSTLYPYTGSDFSGNPVDPINIVFAGNASAVTICNALLALDGDRTASGFPPVAPFTDTWSDALGGVQTAYVDGAGWVGSVIQLSLGGYGPVRVHLRLFESRQPYGDGGTWTLGGAHFELLIPGTTDHQVLAWQLAEQVVVADLMRSGLDVVASTTGVISAAPNFRSISPAIYNGIPDELKLLSGLPTGPSAVDVPIPSQGTATVLTVSGDVPAIADARQSDFTLQFNQIIPKPFCSDSPFDFLLVEGPVTLRKRVRMTERGAYSYTADIRGQLTATPVDVTQNPPVPAGEPFNVTASDVQHGFITNEDAKVSMQGKRIIISGGAEKQFISLEVHERGNSHFDASVKCLED